jgi:hypothetical protein
VTISLRDLSLVDWDDVHDVDECCNRIFDWLTTDRKAMASLVDGVRDNPALQAISDTNAARFFDLDAESAALRPKDSYYEKQRPFSLTDLDALEAELTKLTLI